MVPACLWLFFCCCFGLVFLLWHSSFSFLSRSDCTQQPNLVFRLSLPTICSQGFPQKWLIFLCLEGSWKKEAFNLVYRNMLWGRTIWSLAVLWAGFLCAIQQRANSSEEAKMKGSSKGSISMKSSALDYIFMWAHCSAMYYQSLWKKLR